MFEGYRKDLEDRNKLVKRKQGYLSGVLFTSVCEQGGIECSEGGLRRECTGIIHSYWGGSSVWACLQMGG